MNEPAALDTRPATTYLTGFYDVHYWPHDARVLMIHQPAGQYGPPLLTDLTVAVSSDAVSVADTVSMVALVMAEAGKPAGTLVEHRADGSIAEIALGGLARTELRPADAR